MMSFRTRWIGRALLGIVAIAPLGAACTSKTEPVACTAAPTALSGAADAHCTSTVAVNAAACHGGTGAGGAGGAGGSGIGGSGGEEEAATLHNAEGDDDDCKYHVAWTADCGSAGTTITLQLTEKATGHPVTGAEPFIEAFLTPTHVAPNAGTTTSEPAAGTYVIGPVAFDAPGAWTMRFHFFHDCVDTVDSPHAHVAFFVNVP